MARYTSCPGLFGQTNYYDESGNRVAESWPGVTEGTTSFYDTNGELIGSSCIGLAADQVYRNSDSEVLGSSIKTTYGNAFYDENGDFAGTSSETLYGDSFDFF